MKMNVLFMADSYLPHAGGSRVYYHNIYKRLAEEFGEQVTVLTKQVPSSGVFDQTAASESFRIIRRFQPLRSWKFQRIDEVLLPLLHTGGLVYRTRPDMIHVGDLYPQGVIGMLLKRIFGVPYAVYCHGEEITQADRHRTERRMRDAIYRTADIVIAASAFAQANLVRIGIPETKIHKITPGVDCRRFAPGEPRSDIVRRFSLQGKQVLLTVARLVPRKGHARVIEALAGLAVRTPNLCYLIVGCGPEESGLRRLAKERGVEHLVQFAGFVPDDELPEYYRLCDVMVMPNSEDSGDIEGFGMVFLEANAVGRPVVGCLSGGTREAVLNGETGYLVQPDDTRELTAALERLLTDQELCRRLGSQGMERARNQFDWSSRARRVLELTEATVQRNFPAACGGLGHAAKTDCSRL